MLRRVIEWPCEIRKESLQSAGLSRIAPLSCKLSVISRLDEELTMQSEWQSRCSRVVPTHEGGHHEEHRRNPQSRCRPILRRAAVAPGGEHLRAAGARAPRRDPAVDQVRGRPVSGLLIAPHSVRKKTRER